MVNSNPEKNIQKKIIIYDKFINLLLINLPGFFFGTILMNQNNLFF